MKELSQLLFNKLKDMPWQGPQSEPSAVSGDGVRGVPRRDGGEGGRACVGHLPKKASASCQVALQARAACLLIAY